MKKQNELIHPWLRNILFELEKGRHKLEPYAFKYGYVPHHDVQNKNRSYFAMEYLEQLFVHTFMTELCKTNDFNSVVFLHDGLLLAPPPEEVCITHAMLAACKILDMPAVPCKMTNLISQYNTYTKIHNPAQRPATAYNKPPSRITSLTKSLWKSSADKQACTNYQKVIK